MKGPSQQGGRRKRRGQNPYPETALLAEDGYGAITIKTEEENQIFSPKAALSAKDLVRNINLEAEEENFVAWASLEAYGCIWMHMEGPRHQRGKRTRCPDTVPPQECTAQEALQPQQYPEAASPA